MIPAREDLPTATTSDQTGNYAGVQTSISTVIAKNSLSGGIYGYGQHEHDVFGVVFNDGSNPNFTQPEQVTGGVEEVFVEDSYKPTTWLTLIGGLRQSNFQGGVSENAMYPRMGAAVLIPKLKWVLPRVLWPLLSTAAVYQHFRPGLAIRERQQHQLRSLARRAR